MLTAVRCKSSKPTAKQQKLFDEKGLFLLVLPSGAKGWRFKYSFGSREKLLSLGPFPEVSLSDARDARDAARALVRKGIDPSVDRQAKRLEAAKSQDNTVESVARAWLKDKHRKEVSEHTAEISERRLELHVFPELGRRPIAGVTAPDLLSVLERIQRDGTVETAHRVRSLCGRVWRFAIARRLVAHDIAADLKGALVTAETQHFSAITEPKKLGELLRSIDAYSGQAVTRAALQVMALTFVRPIELRLAKWAEFDLDEKASGKRGGPGGPEWRIPAARMKGRDTHVVPLSVQAAAILNELRKLTGGDQRAEAYVFPSARPRRPLSENTLNMALRNMGYDGETHTAHGFRSTASTRLHEMGCDPQVIELQLAHQIANPVARAYNRSARFEERRALMQRWADYLDAVKADKSNVVAMHSGEVAA